MASRRGKVRQQTAFTAVGVVGGEAYILHGAKRASAWREGLSKPPAKLFVTVHQLLSIAQAESIAAAYDESQRVEQSAKAIKGAYADLNMNIKSHRLRHGNIGLAIYLAFRGSLFEDENHLTGAPINLREAVALIKDELLFLDNLDIPTRVFYFGILAMAIVALAVDPNAKELIEKVSTKQGSKIKGKMDPVESILYLATIAEIKGPGHSTAYQKELYSRALHGFDKWRNANKKPARALTKGMITAVDPGPFVAEFRAAKGITDRIDL